MIFKKAFTYLFLAAIGLLICSCSGSGSLYKSLFPSTFKKTSYSNIQNGNSSPEIMLIPQDSGAIVCRLNKGTIEKLNTLPLPHYYKGYVTKDNFIVCLDTSSHKIIMKQLDQNWQISNSKEITYPESIFPMSILKHDNLIFLGGQLFMKTKDSFMYYNMDKGEWKIIEIPEKITHSTGRSIDDLLIVKDTLYAVDDVVRPKYIIKYNLSDANNIKLISYHEIPFMMGPNGGIHKAILNKDYLIYISGSFSGYSRTSQDCIGILKLSDLKTGFQMCGSRYGGDDESLDGRLVDIAVVNDAVVIATLDRLIMLKIGSNSLTSNPQTDINSLEPVLKIEDGAIVGLKVSEINNAIILSIINEKEEVIERVINL
ncbi:MAG TPA: hypothetical protein VHO43_18390 [Ignavibacteriales bacterium]|nr:hypothetical protein [Ignavibacteriales bacterium]